MHFPGLEVCCDWSTFFPLKSADVRGAGTRDEPLRTSACEANVCAVFTNSLEREREIFKLHVGRKRA